MSSSPGTSSAAGGGGNPRLLLPDVASGPAECLRRLQTLRNKVLRKSDQESVSSAGVVEAVLETLKAFTGESELVMAGGKLLQSVVLRSPVNQAHLRGAGAILVLLKVLATNVHKEALRTIIYRVMWDCTRGVHDDQRPPPPGTAAVDAIIRAMRVSREDKEVQLEACRALLATDVSGKLQQAEDAVLKACRNAGASYDSLSEAGCRALLAVNGRLDLVVPFSTVRKVCRGFHEDQKTHIGTSLAFKGRLRGKDVVVKFVRDVYVYLKEVRALLRLGHPNIEGLVGVCLCADKQPPALIYSVCHGGTLAQQLYPADGEPCKLTPRQRIRIAVDLARAVTFTHGRGDESGPSSQRPPFFHRNIMSSFIGLDTSSPLNAKLFNFSSAVATEYLPPVPPATASEPSLKPRSLRIDRVKLLETEGHIAPEIREKAKFEARSDLYSVGMVLLELLTERRICSDTCQRIAKLTSKGRWPSRLDKQLAPAWRKHCPEVLNGLKRVCLACIHPDEQQRPASAWQVYTQLRELQDLLTPPPAAARLPAAADQESEASEGKAEGGVADGPCEEDAPLPVLIPEERCCLCQERVSRTAGLLCKEAESYGHFTCETCMPRYVLSQMRPALLRVHKGEIRCPHKDGVNVTHWCPAPKWTLDELQPIIGQDVYRSAETQVRAYLVSCLQTHEENLRRRDKWERLKRQARGLAEVEGKVGMYAAMIREDLLDLHCPNCWRVHHNWDACNALICEVVDDVTGEVLGGCGAAFCPWCQIECVKDAHPHVREMHSGYFTGKPDDAKAHCVRKNVLAFLRDLRDEESREVALRTLRAMGQELKEVGVDSKVLEAELSGKRRRETEGGEGAEVLAS